MCIVGFSAHSSVEAQALEKEALHPPPPLPSGEIKDKKKKSGKRKMLHVYSFS
jgi:hypothetical protein